LNLSKKIKIEPEEKIDTKQTPVMSLLSKPIETSTNSLLQSSVGQIKKSNISSFIKKKTETNTNNNTNPSTSSSCEKPAVSLLNMMSSYGTDSEED
jgi:hypothetical protein